MKTHILIVFGILTYSFCMAQNGNDTIRYSVDTIKIKRNTTFMSKDFETIPSYMIDSLDRTATFESCDYITENREREKCLHKTFYSFLSQNIIYPRKAIRKGIEGQLIVSFVINKEGNIEDLKIIKSSDQSGLLDQETIRVVSKFPKFIPAIYKTNIVKVKYQFPIKFSLPKD